MYQYPKTFLSVSQLIQKLIDAGMEVPSQDEAQTALTTIGYYRLKGYCYQNFDANTQKYIVGTNFSNILNLYHYDSELSLLIFSYISQIEVALRARLVNAFQGKLDVSILNDPSEFNNKKQYWQNQGAIASEISRSTDIFIQHNFDNHEGAVPLWAAVEVMSFGTLSKTIKNLKTSNGSIFPILVQNYKYISNNGNYVNPSLKTFSSWIQTVSLIRNICAHNGRIYNRKFDIRPAIISTDVMTPEPTFTGLYQILLAMKYLRSTDDSWNIFIANFKQLMTKYADCYKLDEMNFPSDWESHFLI